AAQRHLDAAARGPSIQGFALAEIDRDAAGARERVGLEARIGVAAGAIDQPGVGRVADTAAHGSEPRHLLFEGCNQAGAGQRRIWSTQAALEPARLEVGFYPENGRAPLPIRAHLAAADRAEQTIVHGGEWREAADAEIGIRVGPAPTRVHADVE